MVNRVRSGADPSGSQVGGRAIVKLHGSCNNACVFCHCSNKRHEYRSIEAVEALLDRLPFGIDDIVLSGGEPTIYPELKEVLGLLRRRDLGIGFISNGRMFFYPQFCRSAIESGADYFYISLHASDPLIHDTITRVAGSWKETVGGISNLRQMSDDVEIVVNCVVVRANAPVLCDLVNLAGQTGATLLKFQIPEIKGLASVRCGEKLLPLSQAADVVGKAIGVATSMGVSVAYDGLPYCSLPLGLRNKLSNLATSRVLYMSEVSEESFFPTDQGCRSKSSVCTACSCEPLCSGFYVHYDDLGDLGLTPSAAASPQCSASRGVPDHRSCSSGAPSEANGESGSSHAPGYAYRGMESRSVPRPRRDSARRGANTVLPGSSHSVKATKEEDAFRHVELNIGKLCNNNCLFCTNSDEELHRFVSSEELLAEITRLSAQGFTSIGFLGGEPTIYPDMARIVRHATEKGFGAIHLVSNGRMLSNRDFAWRLIGAGVTKLSLSIHSHVREVEDHLTCVPGGFDQKLRAAANGLDAYRQGLLRDPVTVTMVINKLNYTSLGEFLCFFAAMGVADFRLNFIRPTLRVQRRFDDLVPRYVDVADPLCRALDVANTLGVHLAIGDFPLCLLPMTHRHSDMVGEIHDYFDSVVSFNNLGEDGAPTREAFSWTGERRYILKSKLQRCTECREICRCEGPWTEYVRRYGEEEFHALGGPGTESNMPSAATIQSGRRILHVHLSNVCQNDCIFCNEVKQPPPTSMGPVEDTLKTHARLQRVCFVGAEPTMSPLLLPAVRCAVKEGYTWIELVTNGIALASLEFCRSLLGAGITKLSVSLHAPNAQLSSVISHSAESFAAAARAIEHLSTLKGEYRFEFCINFTVTKLNYERMGEMFRWIRSYNLDRLDFNTLDVVGKAKTNFRQIGVRYSSVMAEYIRLRSDPACRESKVAVSLNGMPRCINPGTSARDNYVMIAASGGDVFAPGKGRVKCEDCIRCRYASGCAGVQSEYIAAFGESEFRPVS